MALNQLDSLIVTAPAELRETLAALAGAARINHCAQLPPLTTTTTTVALRRLAGRIQTLTEEIRNTDAELKPLLAAALPSTMALRGVGPDTAGQPADHPGRQPRTHHHRSPLRPPLRRRTHRRQQRQHRTQSLNRGGDRHANAALYRIVIVRLRYCERTQAYLAKRTADGKTKRETIRCLKRYVAREIYRTLRTDLANNNLEISA